MSSAMFSQEIINALMHGDAEKAKQLIEADSLNAVVKSARGFSPIHLAVNSNLLEISKLLVAKGADPFIVGTFGRQPIHWAAASGSLDVLKWLQSLGADLNFLDEGKKSPLYLAATRGRKETVEYLLSQQVSIQTEGKLGFDLLFFSTQQNISKIIDKFLETDYNFQKKAMDGSNLIMAAARSGNPKLISLFINQGLSLDQLNDFGETALHIAVKEKNIDLISKIIEEGADVNLVNFAGDNALDIALKEGSKEILELLEKNGAKALPKTPIQKIYPGFKEPGLTAKLLAPGLISTSNHNERDIMFSPDMNEFYFTRYSRAKRMPMTITTMKKTNGVWSNPKTAKFSGKINECECFISFDNQKLYFISQRNPDGSDKPSSWEIWEADRINGEWDNFQLMDTTNLKGCFYPSLTKDGEFLYTGVGNDLYLADLKNNKLENITKLGSEINTESGEYNAMISPDGDYIIFTSHGFEDHYGAGDLYISFRKEDGNWAQSINMGATINTEFLEYCPSVSPDGKYFFFTSNKKGTEDIYWISAEIIKQLKEKSLEN